MNKFNIMIEDVLKWQRILLFIAVAIIPLVGPPSITKYFGPFLFYGQPASIPISIGILLAAITLIKEGKIRIILWILGGGFCYIVLLSIISINSITSFEHWSPGVFGFSWRINYLKNVLINIGIDEGVFYKIIVFFKDVRNGFHETIFLFYFVLWASWLYKRNADKTFLAVKNAILMDFAILFIYCFVELCHLYGFGFATQILKNINPIFYIPQSVAGWYPPIVSSFQIRGIWTEPGFFAAWLGVAVPFLLYWVFEDLLNKFENKKIKITLSFLLLFIVFSFWFMTYARTSIWLMFALIVLYGIGTIYWWNRKIAINFLTLIVSFAVAFEFVSIFGPADIDHWNAHKNQNMATSKFVKDTVQSSFDKTSRSTPSRILYWKSQYEIFKNAPILGVGDSLEPWYEINQYRKYTNKYATAELKARIAYVEKNGIFNAGFGGNRLSILSILACRGVVGSSVFFILFFLLFALFFHRIYHYKIKIKQNHMNLIICLFVSGVTGLISAFSQGLCFYNIWPILGLTLGYIINGENELKNE